MHSTLSIAPRSGRRVLAQAGLALATLTLSIAAAYAAPGVAHLFYSLSYQPG